MLEGRSVVVRGDTSDNTNDNIESFLRGDNDNMESYISFQSDIRSAVLSRSFLRKCGVEWISNKDSTLSLSEDLDSYDS